MVINPIVGVYIYPLQGFLLKVGGFPSPKKRDNLDHGTYDNIWLDFISSICSSLSDHGILDVSNFIISWDPVSARRPQHTRSVPLSELSTNPLESLRRWDDINLWWQKFFGTPHKPLFEVCEDDVVSCLKGQAVYLPKFGPKPMGMASDDWNEIGHEGFQAKLVSDFFAPKVGVVNLHPFHLPLFSEFNVSRSVFVFFFQETLWFRSVSVRSKRRTWRRKPRQLRDKIASIWEATRRECIAPLDESFPPGTLNSHFLMVVSVRWSQIFT